MLALLQEKAMSQPESKDHKIITIYYKEIDYERK